MKNIIKIFVMIISLLSYIAIIVLKGDYKVLEIIMSCIEMTSLIIILISSTISTIIGLKLKNRFLVEDCSIVITIIYDILYLFFIIYKTSEIKAITFAVLLIPIFNGLFISSLISYIFRGKSYEQ